jgi:hypothetical protein
LRRQFKIQVSLFVASLACVLSRGATARAGIGPLADARDCAPTMREAQEQEEAAHLLAARDLYLRCASVPCAMTVRAQCNSKSSQIETELPSFVPVISDKSGRLHVLVELKVDGKLRTSRLDGHAISVDPGTHQVTFGTDDGIFASKELLVQAGERNRVVAVKWPVADAIARVGDGDGASLTGVQGGDPTQSLTPSSQSAVYRTGAAERDVVGIRVEKGESHRGSTALTALLAGAGVAGLGGYALLVYWGRKDNNLLAQCKPSCSQGNTDHIRRLYLEADISLGVGVVALGTATWLLLRPHSSEEASRKSVGYAFSVEPTASGALATVGGAL